MDKCRRIPIAQKDSFGCGIACVAFVTGISYTNAKHKLFDENKATTGGYSCRDMVRALKKFGKEYDYRYVKAGHFGNNTIVFIKRSKRYPFGHYLCRVGKGWMGLWINFGTRDMDPDHAIAGFRKRLPGRPIYAIFSRTS